MLDIVNVIFDAAAGTHEIGNLAAQPANLRKTRDARFDTVARGITLYSIEIISVLDPHFGGMRTRPHDRHRALKDVHELRQFIDAEPADERPHASHAGIALDRALCAALILRIDIHRPELEHFDFGIVEAKAQLAKQDRPGAFKADGNGCDQEQRRQDDEANRRQRIILKILANQIEVTHRSAQQSHHRKRADDAQPEARPQLDNFARQHADID